MYALLPLVALLLKLYNVPPPQKKKKKHYFKANDHSLTLTSLNLNYKLNLCGPFLN